MLTNILFFFPSQDFIFRAQALASRFVFSQGTCLCGEKRYVTISSWYLRYHPLWRVGSCGKLLLELLMLFCPSAWKGSRANKQHNWVQPLLLTSVCFALLLSLAFSSELRALCSFICLSLSKGTKNHVLPYLLLVVTSSWSWSWCLPTKEG